MRLHEPAEADREPLRHETVDDPGGPGPAIVLQPYQASASWTKDQIATVADATVPKTLPEGVHPLGEWVTASIVRDKDEGAIEKTADAEEEPAVSAGPLNFGGFRKRRVRH